MVEPTATIDIQNPTYYWNFLATGAASSTLSDIISGATATYGSSVTSDTTKSPRIQRERSSPIMGRAPNNEITMNLDADSNSAENTATNYDDLDFLSNGFKLREENDDINADGGAYVYFAFAEHPFVSSKGIPVHAR